MGKVKLTIMQITEQNTLAPLPVLGPGEFYAVLKCQGVKSGDIPKITNVAQALGSALEDGKVTPEEGLQILMAAGVIPGAKMGKYMALLAAYADAMEDGRIDLFEAFQLAALLKGLR